LNAHTLSILVVTDDRGLRETVCDALQTRGCLVTAAATGVEGLRGVALGRFDAVVTHVSMLSRGGLWLWRGAAALRPELVGRFIFCGANGVPDSFDGPFRSERFLSEPLDLSILWAEIRAVTHGDAVESS